MMKKFEKGDIVTWTSQSGGYTKVKKGKVIGVVPPFQYPEHIGISVQKYPLKYNWGLGSPRNHESYLIGVPPELNRKSGKIYWPKVKYLNAVSETHPIVEEIKFKTVDSVKSPSQNKDVSTKPFLVSIIILLMINSAWLSFIAGNTTAIKQQVKSKQKPMDTNKEDNYIHNQNDNSGNGLRPTSSIDINEGMGTMTPEGVLSMMEAAKPKYDPTSNEDFKSWIDTIPPQPDPSTYPLTLEECFNGYVTTTRYDSLNPTYGQELVELSPEDSLTVRKLKMLHAEIIDVLDDLRAGNQDNSIEPTTNYILTTIAITEAMSSNTLSINAAKSKNQ